MLVKMHGFKLCIFMMHYLEQRSQPMYDIMHNANVNLVLTH